MAASDKVFCITELLEHILLEASTRDVLLAQRVSRTFRATITQSLPLQRKLFLVPTSPPASWESDDIRVNDLLCAFFNTKPRDIKTLLAKAPQLESTPERARWRVVQCRLQASKTPYLAVQLEPTHPSIGRLEELRTPSWKRMYLTQPALPAFVMIMEPNGSCWLKHCSWFESCTMFGAMTRATGAVAPSADVGDVALIYKFQGYYDGMR